MTKIKTHNRDLLWTAIIVVLAIAALFVFGTRDADGASKARSHAQVSSSVDQWPDSEPLTFDFVDSSAAVQTDGASVTVERAGLYLIVIAPQVTAEEPDGCFEAWLRINGDDVDNSNVELCFTEAGATDVIVAQGVLPLAAGDVLEFIGYADGAFADAIDSSAGGPLIPSHISSIAPLAP